MTRALILATLAVILTTPASAKCVMSYCQKDAPSRAPITNTSRQVVGDLYNPGYGRRVQIRTNQRVIIGFIEVDGTITDTRRRRVGSIQDLSD